MQRGVTPLLRGLLWVSGVVAVWALDQGVFWLAATLKPLTTLLLFAVIGQLNTTLRRTTALGLAFSLLGDVALLGRTGIWFQAGLGAFLITHVCYVRAFWPFARRRPRLVLVASLAIAGAIATVVVAGPEAAKTGVRVPVAVYAAALSTMFVVCNATLGGPLREAKSAALGAALFYFADLCIAVNVFVPWFDLPHPAVFTTGVYWIGQYHIAFAARVGTAG